MSSRALTFLGFAVIAAGAVVWAFVSAGRPNLVTLPRLLARLTRSRLVRLLILLGWGWVGWHLFARGSGAFP
jgi:hypothetical protein